MSASATRAQEVLEHPGAAQELREFGSGFVGGIQIWEIGIIPDSRINLLSIAEQRRKLGLPADLA